MKSRVNDPGVTPSIYPLSREREAGDKHMDCFAARESIQCGIFGTSTLDCVYHDIALSGFAFFWGQRFHSSMLLI